MFGGGEQRIPGIPAGQIFTTVEELPPEMLYQIQNARQLYENGNIEGAQQLIEDLYDQSPFEAEHTPILLQYLGRIYAAQHRYCDASRQYARFLDEAEDFTHIPIENREQLHRQHGEFEIACEESRRAEENGVEESSQNEETQVEARPRAPDEDPDVIHVTRASAAVFTMAGIWFGVGGILWGLASNAAEERDRQIELGNTTGDYSAARNANSDFIAFAAIGDAIFLGGGIALTLLGGMALFLRYRYIRQNEELQQNRVQANVSVGPGSAGFSLTF
jgi:tetratricopeptide (TPR) repeat protein